jgi:hypothetical protein
VSVLSFDRLPVDDHEQGNILYPPLQPPSLYVLQKQPLFFPPCLLTCVSTRKILFHVDIIVASAGGKTRVRRMTHGKTATTLLGQDCLSEGSQVAEKHFTDIDSQILIHHLSQVRDGKLVDT